LQRIAADDRRLDGAATGGAWRWAAQGWEQLRHPYLHQPLECRTEGLKGGKTVASIDIGLDRSSVAPAAGTAQPHMSASVGTRLELA
jgi:hypothetical protein